MIAANHNSRKNKALRFANLCKAVHKAYMKVVQVEQCGDVSGSELLWALQRTEGNAVRRARRSRPGPRGGAVAPGNGSDPKPKTQNPPEARRGSPGPSHLPSPLRHTHLGTSASMLNLPPSNPLLMDFRNINYTVYPQSGIFKHHHIRRCPLPNSKACLFNSNYSSTFLTNTNFLKHKWQ